MRIFDILESFRYSSCIIHLFCIVDFGIDSLFTWMFFEAGNEELREESKEEN